MKTIDPLIRRRIGLLAAATLMLCAAPGAARADDGVLRIGGTGMALAATQQLGESLTAADPKIRVEVLPSLGTPGGLRALADEAIGVAVIGRSLKADEKAQGASEAACMLTPLGFASANPAPGGIAKADLPGIYANPAPAWPDGRPLKVLLRSRAGSEYAYLIAAIPGMQMALDVAHKRPGVPVGTTDQENAEMATRVAGSFAIMTLMQIRAERLNLKLTGLDGVEATPDAVAGNAYPLSVRFCVVLPGAPTVAALKFAAHLQSPAGQALMHKLGATPAK